MEQQTEERRPVMRSALHKACAQWTPIAQKKAVVAEKMHPGNGASRTSAEVNEHVVASGTAI